MKVVLEAGCPISSTTSVWVHGVSWPTPSKDVSKADEGYKQYDTAKYSHSKHSADEVTAD